MNIISCCMLLLILIAQAINGLELMENANDESTISVCKGNNAALLWNFDEDEKKISKLEWYFNNTLICYSLSETDFSVSNLYQGRIERLGKTGITLKNVSINDEGRYIFFSLIEWSIREVRIIKDVRVLESPTDKCTCKMGLQEDVNFELAVSDCGRPIVKCVWKRKQTLEGLKEGNKINNSTFQDKEILGCLYGEAIKCVNDSRWLCTNVSISNQHNEISSADGNTQSTDLVAVSVSRDRDSGSNNIIILYVLVGVLSAVVVILTLLVIVIIRYHRNRKKKADADDIHSQMKNILLETNKGHSKILKGHQSALKKNDIQDEILNIYEEQCKLLNDFEHASNKEDIRSHVQKGYFKILKDIQSALQNNDIRSHIPDEHLNVYEGLFKVMNDFESALKKAGTEIEKTEVC